LNKLLLIIIIISLLICEGCSVIGYSIGKKITQKETIIKEEIEQLKENEMIIVTLKNNEVIEGKFISCINDTLLVSFLQYSINTPISDQRFLMITKENAFYKFPLNQVIDVKISKANYGSLGMLVGLVVDIIVIKMIRTVVDVMFVLDISFWGP